MVKQQFEFEDGPILVDLSQTKPRGNTIGIGYREASQDEADDASQAEISDAAVNHALETVYRAAKRAGSMIKSLEDEPLSKMKMEFALTLKDDSSVMIARMGPEIHFRVELIWEKGE